jgi:hypothetical protein
MKPYIQDPRTEETAISLRLVETNVASILILPTGVKQHAI